MVHAIKDRAVVQPGGILQIQRSDLPEGATVEVIVMIESGDTTQAPLPPLSSFWGIAKGSFGETAAGVDSYVEQERSSWD